MKASELIEHLKSYIDITGGDCEMLVFDKEEGVSCDIKNSSTDGDYVFLYISSDKYTTKNQSNQPSLMGYKYKEYEENEN